MFDKKAYNAQYKREHPDAVARWNKTYYPKRGKKPRIYTGIIASSMSDRRRQLNYGLTDLQFQTMMLVQCGTCAVCSEIFESETRGKEPCVDHDHETGRVRGLLCHSCNKGIGHLKDSSEILMAAMAYLDMS